jgi:hypothetical protein
LCERRIEWPADKCCLPEDNYSVHAVVSTALKWSKQISVLRFVSVDMFMIIETKVFLREFDNFNYESFDVYLA